MSTILVISKTDTAKRRMQELWEIDYQGNMKDYMVGKSLTAMEYNKEAGVISIGPTKNILLRTSANKLWSNDIVISQVTNNLKSSFTKAGLLFEKDFVIEVQ